MAPEPPVAATRRAVVIFFLVCRAGNHTVRDSYLFDFSGISGRVRVLNYEGVIQQRMLPGGCYLFTDLERITPVQLPGVMAFYEYLGKFGQRVRRLNHPTRAMMRYELLRTMYECGINDFDVYRVSEERRPVRYPVFLRREDDHEGPISVLLRDPASLARAIGTAIARGHPPDRLLIVEFCDVRDSDGLVRKYGAFYIDGTVVSRHLIITSDWVAKVSDVEKTAPLMPVEDQVREEARYVAENPHADRIREIFALARIDYGRIDYSIKDGRILVWEINTNPMIAERHNLNGGLRQRQVVEPGVRNIAEAVLRLDAGLPAGRFRIEPPIAERLRNAGR
jgi:hypothetical protein